MDCIFLSSLSLPGNTGCYFTEDGGQFDGLEVGLTRIMQNGTAKESKQILQHSEVREQRTESGCWGPFAQFLQARF